MSSEPQDVGIVRVTVSQDAFDELMYESMELLDLTPEQAVDEAVQQLRAQGADLSLLVQVPFTEDGRSPTEQVRGLVAALSQSAQPNAALVELRTYCAQSLAHRCLASACAAFPVLYDAMVAAMADQATATLIALLDGLAALLDGQPDTATEAFLEALVQLLSWPSVALFVVAGRTLRLCCTMHEANRQTVVAVDIIPLLVARLDELRTEPDAVTVGCLLLQSLTLDDDVRAAFGCGHEHARAIMADTPALGLLLELCAAYRAPAELPVATAICGALAHLSVRDEFCQQVLDRHGVPLILEALEAHAADRRFVVAALELIKSLAGNDNVKLVAVEAGVLPLIVGVAAKHAPHVKVATAAAAAVAALCLRQPGHALAFVVGCGGAALLGQLLTLHAGRTGLESAVAAVVRTTASNRAAASYLEVRGALLEADLEALLNCVLRRGSGHGAAGKEAADAAKEALRTLDCKVDLVEMWTGLRGEIPRD